MIYITFLIFFILAYLLGSINSAIIVSKLMHLPDPRQQGSCNPGTTNVLRNSGKLAGGLVLAGDILKGIIPVAFACCFSVHGFLLGMIGVAAVIGHLFPLYFQFKGGKGVATAFGVIFALSLILGLVAVVIFGIITALTRYVSLGSLCSITAMPIFALCMGKLGLTLPLLMMAAVVIWRHSENINRLRNGTENKLTW